MGKLLEKEDETVVIPGDFEDVSELQRDLDQELDSILSEFGGDGTIDEYQIRVYRPQPGKGNVSYLFACLPSELPILDKLRDDYGGGDFEVRIIKNNRIFRKRRTLIEPPIKKKTEPQTNSGDILAIAHAMNTGFTQLGELIAAQNKESNINPMATQAELLQNMVAMKEILGLNMKEKPEKDMFTQLKSMLEMQQLLTPKDIGPGAGTNDVLLGLMNNVLPHLAKLGEKEQDLEQQKSQRQLMARRKRQRQINQPGDNPMKMHLIFLTQMAKQNADTMTYANMILDNTPVEKIPELVKFISGENALGEMGKTHKKALEYPEWFSKLAQDVLLLINETQDQQPEAVTIPGDQVVPGSTGSKVFVSGNPPKAGADHPHNESTASDS